MIRPEDVIASASIAEHCARAEQYFRQVEEPDRLLAKPFVSLNETPLLLYRLGLLLTGLKVAPTMRVLDFGAGTCWVSGILSGLQCHVVCVDPSETALSLGRRLFERRPAPDGLDPPQFLRFDGETLPVASGSVDRIICFDALHHVPNPGRILAEFHRVLKDGGLAGFSEPGRQHSQSPVSQYEMLHYGVIENDIELEVIKRLSDEAGFSQMLAAAESGFETWLDFAEAQQVWEQRTLPERWTTANLHSFHGRATFVLQKGRYRPDSRLAEGLAGELQISQHEIEVRAGEPLIFDVQVRNTGSARWLAHNAPDIGAVKIGAKIRAAATPDSPPQVHRTRLPHDLDPGDAADVAVEIKLSDAGEYDVALDLLDEQIVWFETLGLTPSRLHVSVLPRPPAVGTEADGGLRLPYVCDIGRISSKLLTGFSASEGFGRWTTSGEAAVDLPGTVPPVFRLVLSCQAFGPNVGRDLALSIGGRVRVIRLTTHEARRYDVVFEDVPRASRVELAIPAPTSPSALGVGEDDRLLGIALGEVRIEPVVP